MKRFNTFRLRKRLIFITILFLILCFSQSLYAKPFIPGVYMLLTEKIIDLRSNHQLRTKSNNAPGRYSTPEDLVIGSIFLTTDNKARKVVNIYERNGKTIIETIEPRVEEVFHDIYIPDFEIECNRSHINTDALPKGVTLLPANAKSSDMLGKNLLNSDNGSRSVNWINTDPDSENKDIYSFNVDIPLWGKGWTQDLFGDDDDDNSDDGDDGGGAEGEIGVELSVDLLGTLQITKPIVRGGLKSPRISISWITHWWHPPIPYFEFERGYAKASVEMAQQFDFYLSGSISLSAELKIPIAELILTNESGTIMFSVGLYAKIGIDGKITVGVETSEYTKHEIGASCDLIWPFIPVSFDAYQDTYLNCAFRPIIEIEAELKAGLYIGGEFKLVGISIVGAEGGGGLYIEGKGRMEPLYIMGYDTVIGGYGSFSEGILEIEAEAGAFAEISASILFWEIDIWSQKWPFWEYYGYWEF